MVEKKFKRHFDALDEIFAFAGRFLSEHRLDESAAFPIHLAVEELFTNMVKYNSAAGGDIAIRIGLDGGRLVLQLIDEDVEPFDPSTLRAVDTAAPLHDRRVGGLGLHLVRSVVDKISYEYQDRRMTVTVVKNLERSDARDQEQQ